MLLLDSNRASSNLLINWHAAQNIPDTSDLFPTTVSDAMNFRQGAIYDGLSS